MIDPKVFFNSLVSHGINFFSGVPDSLLKELCACVERHNVSTKNHVIAANEGNAVALAAGHFLATGKPGLVYMQNSGFGNAVNPLVSLTDKEVYKIPVLLIIGWRGEPGIKDEPQHIKQGRITKALCDVLEIKSEILPKDQEKMEKALERAIQYMIQSSEPYAFIVQKNTFSDFKRDQVKAEVMASSITREEAIKIITSNIGNNDIVISTTGKASRELFEIREKNGKSHYQDFLTVGSMGHSSSIALGVALAKPERRVVCLDGDGAMIMHLGVITTIGKMKPANFLHILLNNGVHESVGGQETAADTVNFPEIAKNCGYKNTLSVASTTELQATLSSLLKDIGPSLLEIKLKSGSRSELARPTRTPEENKIDFVKFVRKDV